MKKVDRQAYRCSFSKNIYKNAYICVTVWFVVVVVCLLFVVCVYVRISIRFRMITIQIHLSPLCNNFNCKVCAILPLYHVCVRVCVRVCVCVCVLSQ